jgi:hypothetical protein
VIDTRPFAESAYTKSGRAGIVHHRDTETRRKKTKKDGIEGTEETEDTERLAATKTKNYGFHRRDAEARRNTKSKPESAEVAESAEESCRQAA